MTFECIITSASEGQIFKFRYEANYGSEKKIPEIICKVLNLASDSYLSIQVNEITESQLIQELRDKIRRTF